MIRAPNGVPWRRTSIDAQMMTISLFPENTAVSPSPRMTWVAIGTVLDAGLYAIVFRQSGFTKISHRHGW